MNNPSLSPVFIVSSGRSGTTLLRGMLNASDQLYIPHESDFLARAYPFYKNAKSFSPQDYQRIAKLFAIASQEHGWGMSKDYLCDQLTAAAPVSFAAVNDVLYAAYLQQQDLSDFQWGIKHPVLIASVDKIFDVFPNAKVVHIVRDGRDVCLSYRQVHESDHANFGPKGALTTALYWIDGLRRIAENKSQQLYELRYEDLLTQPESELRDLCDFLNLKFSDALYQSYYKSDKPKPLLLAQHKNTIHTNVRSGIKKNNQQKFLTKMSKWDRFVFELVAYPYLEKYQYCTEFPVLKTPLLAGVRQGLYALARQFNNWRYKKRYEHTF